MELRLDKHVESPLALQYRGGPVGIVPCVLDRNTQALFTGPANGKQALHLVRDQ
jgi:hypothetical protein